MKPELSWPRPVVGMRVAPVTRCLRRQVALETMVRKRSLFTSLDIMKEHVALIEVRHLGYS